MEQEVKPVRPGDQWQDGYWVAIEAGEVRVQRCSGNHHQFPGGPNCARCGADVEWVPVAGTGRVWSWVVFEHRYFEDFDPPYAVLIIELDEGVRVYAAPDPAEPWEPRIGDPVRLGVGRTNGGRVTVARALKD